MRLLAFPAALLMGFGAAAPAAARPAGTASPASTGPGGGAAPTAARPASPSPAAAAAPRAPKAWALVDADTGNIIGASNDRQPLPPASLTKVVTALAAQAAIPADAEVGVSARAEAVPADKMFMKQGQVWTYDEMIHALLISSANDAAVALAERAGGSVEGFQSLLTATAAKLGMADSPVLHDPAGLDGPDGVAGGNLVSARDLAIATRALLANPALAAVVATTVYYFDGPDNVHHRLTNHNKPFLTTYPGAIGVKTGSTRRAGTCLIAAARRGGRTMLAVVLDGANPTQTAKSLLDEGFATAVETELTADRLPPISSAGRASGPAQQTEVSPAPAASVPAADIRPVRGASSPLGTVIPVAAVTVALIGLLRVRAVSRRRRRRHRGPTRYSRRAA